MSIRLLDIDKDAEAYQRINTKLRSSVFNSLAWLKMFSEIKLYGIYNDNNELTGSFYFFSVKKWGMPINITPPFTPHNGLCFENRAENSANINSFNKNILSEVADFISRLRSQLTVFGLPVGALETQS